MLLALDEERLETWQAEKVLAVAEAKDHVRTHGTLPLDVFARILGSGSTAAHLQKRAIYRLRDLTGATALRLKSGEVFGFDDPRLDELLARTLEPSRELVGAEGDDEGASLSSPLDVAKDLGLTWKKLKLDERYGVEALTTLRLAGDFLRAGLSSRAVIFADRVGNHDVRALLLDAIGHVEAAVPETFRGSYQRGAPARGRHADEDEDDAAGGDWLDEARRLVGKTRRGAIAVDPGALKPMDARKQLNEALAEERARRRTNVDENEAATVEVEAKAVQAVDEEDVKVERAEADPKTCEECGRSVAARGFSSHVRAHARKRAKPAARKPRPSTATSSPRTSSAPARETAAPADPLTTLRDALAALPENARKPALELLLALEASA